MGIKSKNRILILFLFFFIAGPMCSKENPTEPTDSRTQDPYPPFSWDQVPVYAHLRKTPDDFTATEAKFLAEHYNFICISATHAVNKYGSTEQGTLAAARQLKKLNTKIKVLFYWNAVVAYPQFKAHETFARHPQWALKNKNDEYITWHQDNKKTYDLSNPDLRDWWSDVVKNMLVSDHVDGVFIDGLPKIGMLEQKNIREWGESKFKTVHAGLHALLKQTREKVGSNELIIFNGLRGDFDRWSDGGMRYFDYTDGAIIEHFGHFNSDNKQAMANDLYLVQESVKRGKIVILKTWPGFSWQDDTGMSEEDKVRTARKNITFPLACYLVAAGQYAYFSYSWGYRHDYGWFHWYPELDKSVGKPRQEMQQEGWIYTRDFEHAHVRVDLENKTARIDWK